MMKKKQDYNPYGIHEKTPLFTRLTYLVSFGAALVGTFLFFPLLQMAQANSWPSAVYYLFYYLADTVSVGALFVFLGLAVVAISREEKACRKKLLLCEIVSLVGISSLLRIFLSWLTAYLDSVLAVGFKLNNLTLSYLLEAGGFRLLMQGVSSLMNVLVTLVMIFLSLFLVKRAYRASQRRGKVSESMLKIPILVYLAISLVFAIINTVLTVVDIGDFSLDFDVLMTLIMPYVEIALFTLLGYYLLPKLVEWFE